jgi:hypothetical protein
VPAWFPPRVSIFVYRRYSKKTKTIHRRRHFVYQVSASAVESQNYTVIAAITQPHTGQHGTHLLLRPLSNPSVTAVGQMLVVGPLAANLGQNPVENLAGKANSNSVIRNLVRFRMDSKSSEVTD